MPKTLSKLLVKRGASNGLDRHISNHKELWEALKAVWNKISPTVIQNLANLMPRRLEAIIAAMSMHILIEVHIFFIYDILKSTYSILLLHQIAFFLFVFSRYLVISENKHFSFQRCCQSILFDVIWCPAHYPPLHYSNSVRCINTFVTYCMYLLTEDGVHRGWEGLWERFCLFTSTAWEHMQVCLPCTPRL